MGSPAILVMAGAATSAEIDNPQAVAVDSQGDLFIADPGAHVVRKVSPTATISTFAGDGSAGYSGDGGLATSAELNYPAALAVDGFGNVYIADEDSAVVRMVTPAGVISTYAGNGIIGSSGIGGPATSAELEYPDGLAVDGAGDVFISDSGAEEVREVNAQTGDISTIAGNGTEGYSGDNGPATSAQLSLPGQLALDDTGNLFIGESCQGGAHTLCTNPHPVVRKVNIFTGIISTAAGSGSAGSSGNGGSATSAELNYPAGVAVDAEGNLFIGDQYNAEIREVAATTGDISVVAGDGSIGDTGDGGSPTSAEVEGMAGMAIDAHGNLFFTSGAEWGSGGYAVVRVVVGPAGPGFLPPLVALTPQEQGVANDPSVVNACNACVDSPVDTSTGDQFLTRSELTIPGRGIPLSLSESYSTAMSSQNGPLGYGWSWSYGISLTNPDGTTLSSSPSTIRFNQETGAQDAFTLSGSTWTPEAPRVDAQLTHNTDGTWTVTRDGNEFLKFDATGQLVSESDLNGYSTTLAYSSSSIVITDPAGRTLTVTLNSASPPQITQVEDSAGRTVLFSYDVNGNLVTVTNVDGGITSYGYDSSHRLVEERSPRFYSAGSPPAAPTSCSATPPADLISTVYDSNGRVSCQWDADGRQTNFSWVGPTGGGLVNQSTVTNPKGNVTVYDYYFGELVSKTEGYGTNSAATWRYAYDPTTLGTILEEDPHGNVTTASFDSQGNRLSLTDPMGRTTTWTYNAYSEVTSETMPATYGSAGSVTTTYSYDEPAYSSRGAGNLTSVTTPILSPTGLTEASQVTHYVHGSSAYPGDVTAVIDPDGNTWSLSYDADGDRVSETAPATTDNSDSSGSYEDVTSWSYNTATGWVTAQMSGRYMLAHPTASTCTTPATGCTTYTYNDMGQTLTTTDGNGHTSVNVYDANGNLTSATDSDGNQTVYAYDPAGEETSKTVGYGTSSAETYTTSYWPDGTVETQTNPAGFATTYTYDRLGHVTSITDPDNRTTNYSYDSDGNLLVKGDPGVTSCTVTSTAKGCTIYTYDADNELTGVDYNDPATPNVTYSYDSDSRKVSMTDGSGTTTWSYDSLGRLVSTTNGAGATIGYTYDQEGNQTSVVYPSTTGTVSRTFDAQGRESVLTDWEGNTTTFTYNADGQLAGDSEPASMVPVTDAYTYDPAGAISSITVAHGTANLGSFAYTRDADDQVTASTETGVPDPNDTTYTYNPLNQLTADNTGNYSYDQAGDPTGLANGTTQTFDGADQLTATSQTATITRGAVTTNTATANSTLTLITPAGAKTGDLLIAAVTTSAQDGLTTSPGWQLAAATQNGLSYTWVLCHVAAAGDQTTWDFDVNEGTAMIAGALLDYHNTSSVPIDATAVTTRNSDGSLSSTQQIPTVDTHNPGDQIVDIVGYLGDITATAPAADTQRAEVQSPLSTVLVSDRTQAQPGQSASEIATSNLPTESESISVAIAPATYGYDSRGDRTTGISPTGTATTYTYNEAGQLTGYANAPTTASYTYNGDGWRVTKTVNGGPVESYTYDPTGPTPQIIVDGTTDYIYGPNGHVLEQITSNTGPLFYHQDQLGSTRIITNTNGTVVGSATYDAYGNTIATTGTTTPIGFAGAYADPETGYLYLINRYYDPTTAQFLTVDPLVAQTETPYLYTGDAPTTATDPSGLCRSNVFSPEFWTEGNCLSGLVGGPDGGAGETLGGVIKSVSGIVSVVAAVGSVVATGGISLGVYSATDITVSGTVVYEGDTLVGATVSIEVADSSATTAANIATNAGWISAGASAAVDCYNSFDSTCAWDLLEAEFSYGTSQWPGGFTGAAAGTGALVPSPFSDGTNGNNQQESSSQWYGNNSECSDEP